MAEKNQDLLQHIDKISYGVAAVVGIVLLVLPIVTGGDVSGTRDDLNKAINDLETETQRKLFDPPPERELEEEIREQWRPGDGGEDPLWVTGAAPVLLKKAQSIQKRPATHAPGVITEISAHRDPEKKQVYLTVKGAMGAGNEFVTIEKVELFRREGVSGRFERVAEFDGDFEYHDYDVNAGQTYTYKFTTVAARDPAAPSNIQGVDSVRQESSEVETPPIPYDYSVDLKQTVQAQQLGERPSAYANFRYWDYAEGKVSGKNDKYVEKTRVGGRFEILRVDSEKRSITVKDRERRGPEGRKTISQADEPFPIDLWPPVSGSAAESPQEMDVQQAVDAETETPAAEPATAPSEAPAPRTRTRTGRSF